MDLMRTSLSNLLTANLKLIAGVSVSSGQKDLLAAELKKVKSMINKAGNLRCRLTPSLDGDNKQKVVSLCRDAIAQKNFYSLISIISSETG